MEWQRVDTRTDDTEIQVFFRGDLPDGLEDFYDHDDMPDPRQRLNYPGTDYEIEDATVTVICDEILKESRPLRRNLANVAEFCPEARERLEKADATDVDD